MENNTAQIEARVQKLESLAQHRGGGGSIVPFGASTVVWRPGGVTAGNVFATWPEVVAEVATLNGDVTIGIDVTLAAAVIPAGAWDLRPAGIVGPVDMVNATPSQIAPFVTIANAVVTLHGLTGLDDIQLENRSTVNVMTTGVGTSLDFYLRGFASLYQSVLAGAGVSFFAAAGGVAPFDLMIYLTDFSYVGSLDGGVNAVRVAGSLSQITIEDASIFDTNQLVSPAGAVNVLVTSTEITSTALKPYESQASAPTIVPFGFVQRGTASIAVGTGKTAAIAAFITSASRIQCTQRTPVTDGGATPTVRYAALTGDRVNGNPGTFQISALTNAGAGATNPADASAVDYEVFSA